MNTLHEFKAYIKTLISEIIELKKNARDSNNPDQSTAQYQLHKKRIYIRSCHIAYSLLKGRQYETIERSAVTNPPSWYSIDQLKKQYGPQPEVAHV